MEKIQWNVEEQIAKGKRGVYLEIANNTEYTITSFSIQFAEQENLKAEERESFFSSMISYFSGMGYELDEDYLERMKKKQITISAETERVISPGESIAKIPCCYYSGHYIVDKIPQYEVTEPDIATICYIRDELIYTAYFDFHSGKYSEDEDPEPAYYWTDGELGVMVPKPDAEVVKRGFCDEIESYDFYVYGVSEAGYKSYVNQCKELGYTKNAYASERFYSAKNTDGYKIMVDYDEDEWEMEVYLNAP